MKGNFLVMAAAVAAVVGGVSACREDQRLEGGGAASNLVVESASGASVTRSGSGLSTARVFGFLPGAPAGRLFQWEVLNVARTATRLSANVREGDWQFVIVAPPAGVPLELPRAGATAGSTPAYVYRPTVDAGGRSADAAEILLAEAPARVVSGRSTSIATRLERNVALVEVLVARATGNFSKAADAAHRVELHGVPSTISYAGGLLPDRVAPDTVAGGVAGRLSLVDSPSDKGFLRSDTLRFVIPAHRGGDFEDARPADTTTLRMALRVDMERAGGGRFVKSVEIPVTAKCNKVLRVRLKVSDGVAVSTSVLPWVGAEARDTVGESLAGWLYVKRGEGGSGQSWRDALPDVPAAIARRLELEAGGVAVHGILVAGDSLAAYDGGFSLPARTRVFGGWSGKAGTELPAGDSLAPYVSAHRDLAGHKAVARLGAGDSVVLNAAGTVLDGFVLTGGGGGTGVPLAVRHATARVNAVELRGLSTNAARVLVMSAGTATNVLVADNNKGVAAGGAATMVNATIVNNGDASSFEGVLRNSVYWGNVGVVAAAGVIEHCAFAGATPPAGKGNLPLNGVNTAWFSATDTLPGPRFRLAGGAKYAVLAASVNKSPLVGRGEGSFFDDATPLVAAAGKRDVDGNPRHNGLTDIGCYEAVGQATGFSLSWNMSRVYMSSKSISTSEHALILADNSQKATVAWRVEVAGSYTSAGVFKAGEKMSNASLSGATSGSGDGVIPGFFHVLSDKDANTSSNEVPRGRLRVRSRLGVYLPDVEIDIYQPPGNLRPWTDGYIGSFHRNAETKERYIHGVNSGDWTIRVISGIDWIKIDGNDKGAHGGEVQEAPGGELKGKNNIKFRVGMKSALPPGAAPRYGLITIHKSGGLALFFVRQGEEADYIFRPEDPRAQGQRASARKFAPYALRDPLENTNTNGRDVGKNGGVFTDYPTKIGYFFQWNRQVAYLLKTAKGGKNIPDSQTYTAWDANREVCPPGYRHADLAEWVHSVYWNVEVPATGNHVTPGGDASLGNFLYGRYADGYYDQIAPDPVTSSTNLLGTGANMAKRGILMINHYNYASVFFPCAGSMARDGNDNGINGNDHDACSVNWLSNLKSGTTPHNTHWDNGHIGISCTTLGGYHSANVRCVKE
jgi:hypothetical protein